MEKYKVSMVYDHRRRTEMGHEGPVEVRITVNRKSFYINTNVRIRADEWAGSVINRPDSAELNERLWYLMKRVTEEVTALQKEGKAVDVDVIRQRLWSNENADRKDGLLEWIAQEVEKLRNKESTKKHYETLLLRMREYGRITRWRDLTTANIYEFDCWLRRLKRPVSNGDVQAGRESAYISDATVYNYHKNLKAMLNRAVKLGLIEASPYNRLKGEFQRGGSESTEFLTDVEVDAVESLRPIEGTQMAMARDLFILQIYTGMSYSDTQVFDIRDYKRVLVEGAAGEKVEQWTHVGKRIKTGVAYVSVLLPPAVEVLKRHNWQAPKIGNAQYNACLKVIQQALGIRTRLHSHLGRHTFATRALAMGVKLQNVSKMLGHTNVKQTERYAKVLAESVHDDFMMMAVKLKERH